MNIKICSKIIVAMIYISTAWIRVRIYLKTGLLVTFVKLTTPKSLGITWVHKLFHHLYLDSTDSLQNQVQYRVW